MGHTSITRNQDEGLLLELNIRENKLVSIFAHRFVSCRGRKRDCDIFVELEKVTPFDALEGGSQVNLSHMPLNILKSIQYP